MPQHDTYEEENIICPFFCGENKLQIQCEGMCEGTQNIFVFKTPTEKRNYKINYCNRYGYMDCPYYKILDLIRYQEENAMGKTLEEKLEGATKTIKMLKKEKKAVERDNYALKYQVDWRERELRKASARTESTEMLTKYLVSQIAGGEEVRIPISEMAVFMSEYDLIAVQDKITNEIVCNLVEKKTKKILDKNYNEYQNYCMQLVNESKEENKKAYSNFVRIKEPGPRDNRDKLIREAIKTVKEEERKIFPPDVKEKLIFSEKVFDNNKGSIIVAWFAVEK